MNQIDRRNLIGNSFFLCHHRYSQRTSTESKALKRHIIFIYLFIFDNRVSGPVCMRKGILLCPTFNTSILNLNVNACDLLEFESWNNFQGYGRRRRDRILCTKNSYSFLPRGFLPRGFPAVRGEGGKLPSLSPCYSFPLN